MRLALWATCPRRRAALCSGGVLLPCSLCPAERTHGRPRGRPTAHDSAPGHKRQASLASGPQGRRARAQPRPLRLARVATLPEAQRQQSAVRMMGVAAESREARAVAAPRSRIRRHPPHLTYSVGRLAVQRLPCGAAWRRPPSCWSGPGLARSGLWRATVQVKSKAHTLWLTPVAPFVGLEWAGEQ
jgi:hypothetical protein